MNTHWEKLAQPRLCGLLAERPTGLSAAMHNAGFQHLRLPFVYETFDSTDTAASLKSLRARNFRGLSLTIPHKERALELVDELDPDAQKIGAINTIINSGTSLFGTNTDVKGITDALAEVGIESLSGKRILLLGAGGAARAASVALRAIGAVDISIANRNSKRAEKLATEFQLTVLPFDSSLTAALGDIDLLVNISALGSKLAPAVADDYPFLLTDFSSKMSVFEAVTNQTPLLEAARNAGCINVAGLRMLLFQALQQFELFTEQAAPREVMERALYEVAG